MDRGRLIDYDRAISRVLGKLVLFAFLVAFVPISMYFTTLKYVFAGTSLLTHCFVSHSLIIAHVHLMTGSTAKAAISAIVSANIIMVAYVVVAFREDIVAAPPKGIEMKKKLQ